MLFLALVTLLIKHNHKYSYNKVAYVFVLISLLTIIIIYKFGFAWYAYNVEWVPYLMELKPIIYLYISIIWIISFGKIDTINYIYYGFLLGVIVVLNFLIESIFANKFILPLVSGERNYDACLLLISFTIALNKRRLSKNIYIVFIILGLLLTFSRTALFAATIIMIFSSKIRLRPKIISGIIFLIFIIFSFLIRDLPLNSLESMDRYWMWSSAINLLIEEPSKIWTGFPVGLPLPVSIPPALEWLWGSQTDAWGLAGVYPFHLHAFWLRILVTWGVPVMTLILLWFVLNVFSRNEVKRGLGLLVLLEGLTMGVFYISNVGIPLFLAFLSASYIVNIDNKSTLNE